MKKLVLLICLIASVGIVAQQQRRGGGAPRGAEPPHPSGLSSKAPDQGWVAEAWNPHEGGLLRVKVHLRFGVEPLRGSDAKSWKSMPAGWYFGRVSMVANDQQNNVYVLHRNGEIDPLVVFDSEGNYLRSWGKGVIGDPHGIRVDRENNVWVVDRAGAMLKYTTTGKLLKTWNHLGSTQGIWISPKDEMYILTHRNNVENITADTLAGRLMKLDLESGKVLGSMESPGHSVNGAPNGDIFVGSLTGNVLRWMPHPEFTRSH